MALTLNGTTNTIGGLAVGGLPDGIVDTDMLAASAVTAAKASGRVKGITEADQWRINSTFSASDAYITANWERNDVNFDKIGTGMTESSGVFSFPSTGIYLINYTGNIHSQNEQRFVGVRLYITGDNSSYTNRADAGSSVQDDGSYWFYANFSLNYILDVTNTTNIKVKFYAHATNTANYNGDSSKQSNGVTFIKLGDT